MNMANSREFRALDNRNINVILTRGMLAIAFCVTRLKEFRNESFSFKSIFSFVLKATGRNDSVHTTHHCAMTTLVL